MRNQASKSSKKRSNEDTRISQNVFSTHLSSGNNICANWTNFDTNAEVGDEDVESVLQQPEVQNPSDLHSYTVLERRTKANTILCTIVLAPLGTKWVMDKLIKYSEISIPVYTSWCLTVANFVDKTAKATGVRVQDLSEQAVREFLLGDVDTNNATIRMIFGMKLPPNNPKGEEQSDIRHPLLDKFVSSMVANGRNPSSIKTTVHPIEQFLDWVCRVYVQFHKFNSVTVPVWNITSEHLQEYRRHLQHLVGRGDVRESTAQQYLRRLKTFFNFCQRERIISQHPMDRVHDLPSTASEVLLPSSKELNRFFEVVLQYSDRPIVDFAAFVGLLVLGLRGKELARLKWTDIDLKNRMASIWRKGERTHKIPLPQYFLDCLSLLDSDREGSVFANNADSFAAELYYRYRAFELLAGWKRRTGLHIFRHLYVTGLTHGEYDIRSVMYLTNHVNSYVLQRYIHRLDDELRAAVNRIIQLRSDTDDN